MAAPSSVTLKNLDGQYVMNKTLSDDIDKILTMQGVGWFLRRAISLATITLTIKEYTDDDKFTHIDVDQVATGGVGGTTEKRTLDWTFREKSDRIFGKVKGKSRWIKLDDVDDKFLKEGWLDEIKTGGGIQAYVESIDSTWTADQIWGFEEIGGKRYHTRHLVCRKGKDWKQARLVYDYQAKQ
ncbi:MAG: hypothetical protein M1827_005540 [Pycnora praestabilis]|nr:MAG: hypothetical protein M1827_005540 [Pycnora praestabilis]